MHHFVSVETFLAVCRKKPANKDFLLNKLIEITAHDVSPTAMKLGPDGTYRRHGSNRSPRCALRQPLGQRFAPLFLASGLSFIPACL